MAPGSRTIVRNLAADADLTLEDRSGTSSRTSTAAHGFSPSHDPELAGVIDGYLTICRHRGAAPVP
jgi:hypothetical protein